MELRTTMYPYTAINLKESKVNSIKDFLSIVDLYGLSHMIMLTNTDKNSYIRFAKMPRGPTITFRLPEYSLAADVFEDARKNSKYNPKPLTKSFNHVPLVIMNGFNSNKIPNDYVEPLKITSMLIQSIFPPINLNEIQLKKCKRVVLFNLSFDSTGIPVIEFRHYDIDIEKFSVKKTISNIINNSKSNLNQFNNIADYVLKQSGFTSCSDNEDPNLGVCDVINDNESKDDKVKVKLYEIGPRMNMKIHKIEEGFLKGNVMFHSIIKKSKKEIKEIMDTLKTKRKEKKERKAKQEENVNKKRPEEVEAKKEEKLLKKKREREKEKEKKKKNDHVIMTKRSLKQFKNLKKNK